MRSDPDLQHKGGTESEIDVEGIAKGEIEAKTGTREPFGTPATKTSDTDGGNAVRLTTIPSLAGERDGV